MRLTRTKIAFNNAGRIGRGNDISNIVENLSTSTNNVLIIGLLERGIDEVYQFNSSSVRLEKSVAVTDAVKLELINKKARRNNNSKVRTLVYGNVACSYIETIRMKLNEFDLIFIRGDDIESNPEVVETYEEAQKPLYLNSPEGTIVAMDKFEIKPRSKHFGIKIPQTYNATNFQELLDYLKKIPSKYKVIKARYGFGGKQVWRVTSNTREKKLRKIYEQCDDEAIVQKYRPIIEQGDLRLNVFDGEVIGNGAILRRSNPGRWQTNIDLGGSQSPYPIDKRIRSVAKKVSEAYPEVRLQGVDLFLDGTFIETNAYPTTLGYTQKHFGVRARDIILDKIDEVPNKLEQDARLL